MLASKVYELVEIRFIDKNCEMQIVSGTDLPDEYKPVGENKFIINFHNWYVKRDGYWKLVDEGYKNRFFGETYKQLRDFYSDEPFKCVISRWYKCLDYNQGINLTIEIVKIFGE